MKTVNRKVGYLILIVGLVACSAKSVKNSEEKDTDSVSIEVPSFDTDSAYAYIERQVQFGFRVPNTPAHLATADYLSSELARHGAVVEVQQGTVTAYDGTELSIRNIIGSFSPEKKNRITYGHLSADRLFFARGKQLECRGRRTKPGASGAEPGSAGRDFQAGQK